MNKSQSDSSEFFFNNARCSFSSPKSQILCDVVTGGELCYIDCVCDEGYNIDKNAILCKVTVKPRPHPFPRTRPNLGEG